jgi:stage II sporulation protein D
VVKNNFFSGIFPLVLVCTMVSCTGLPFLVPNPPSAGKKETAETPSPQAQSKTEGKERSEGNGAADSIDFAVAFDIHPPSAAGGSSKVPPAVAPVQLPVHGTRIRVALRQNCSRAVLFSSGNVEARSLSIKNPFRCSGRLVIEARGAGRIAVTDASGSLHEVALPCTLLSMNESNRIFLDQASYRGSMILAGERLFSIVNYIAVEDYLRGVLPLEMGRRVREEIEALKAQAIVARTYAYKRIRGRSGEPFDLLSTVADQVYGGVDIETAEADNAVSATAGLVLSWRDSLADVYYYSTCGGRTANIEEVWGTARCPYLSSQSDIAPDGRAYCAFASQFNWEETWDAGELSNILHSTVKKTMPDEQFNGNLKAIKVDGRFGCGRVKSCRLCGTGETVVCGGDKLRFILRRKTADGEILRSANFTVETNGPHSFTLRGKGYGHGVGMCQTGAMARARDGQSCKEILRAYYKEIRIVEVAIDTKGKK